MTISCPYCMTTADTNPNRTSAGGHAVPPVGSCLCGMTKIKTTKES